MKNNTVFSLVKQTAKKSKLLFLLAFITTLAVVAASLAPPQIMRLIIDKNLSLKTLDGLFALTAAYVSAIILIGIFDFLKGGLLVVLGQKIVKNIRREMSFKMSKLPMSYFTQGSPGEITSHFTNDVDNVNSMFSEGIISMVIDCLKIVGIVISMAIFSKTMGVIALMIIPCVFVITRVFQKKMLAAQVENLKQLGAVNNHISESLKNVSMIKAYSKETFMEELYIKHLNRNFTTIERVNFYDSIYAPIIQIIRATVIVVIVVLSSSSLNISGISLGMIAASIELISNLFLPIETLGAEFQSIQKGLSGVKRIDEFLSLEQQEEKNESLSIPKILNDEGMAEFDFENLSFSYGEKEVLSEINLSVPPKSKITFAGRTGVGKTTLFKLIMGLEKPTQGRILINGIDVYTLPNRLKRSLIGYVEQSFSFVEGSVEKQISLGDENISRDMVISALDFVGLKEQVEAMENGLDTIVKSEGDFSQGQKQLLAIARAIAPSPPVLLLDEVTANLDSATEEKVMQILSRAGSGRTILSVSHRLSSMMNSDLVVVIENGKIRAKGSAAQLMESDEWFKEISKK
ncbi:MAG: ABC transporter ATP-binding protein [Oscillospiraceae bacterium]